MLDRDHLRGDDLGDGGIHAAFQHQFDRHVDDFRQRGLQGVEVIVGQRSVDVGEDIQRYAGRGVAARVRAEQPELPDAVAGVERRKGVAKSRAPYRRTQALDTCEL